MPIDWPTIAAFVLIEALFVLIAAPFIIQRRNEARAVQVFRTKLLPLMPAAPKVPTVADIVAAMPPVPSVDDIVSRVHAVIDAVVRDRVPEPTPEQQAAARAELGAAVGQAVQAAVAEAVKGRMGALSAQAGDARVTKALHESTLKARVGEKYGLKGLGALKLLQVADKDLYALGLDAVAYAPGSLDEWLEEHADWFTLEGKAGGKGAKPKVVVV